MARGDTLPPRRHFSDADDAPIDTGKPKRRAYPCRARSCPMPGTMFTGSTDEDGICALHFGCNADEVTKTTQAILDWQCIVDVVLAGRVYACDVNVCTNHKEADRRQAEAWAKLVPAVEGSGWKQRVAIRSGEHFVEWSQRLSRFLANRVKERRLGIVIADDDAPTPVVAEIRKGLKVGRPTADWPND